MSDARRLYDQMSRYDQLSRLSSYADRIDKLSNPTIRALAEQNGFMSRVELATGALKFAQGMDLSQLGHAEREYMRTAELVSKLGMPRTAAESETLRIAQQEYLRTEAIMSGLPRSVVESAALGVGQYGAIRQAMEYQKLMAPSIGQISEIAAVAASLVTPHRKYIEAMQWHDSLTARMNGIAVPWAASDYLEHSGLAFSQLARLSDTVMFDAPFARSTRDFVESEFGEVVEFDDEADSDARERGYDEAGRDTALVVFPQPEYPLILRAAGFSFEIPLPPTPQPIANTSEPALYSQEHQRALRALEMHLRLFVARMLGETNPDWIKHRVPGQIRERWELRQNERRDAGSPVYELIHYADFNDLAQIITSGKNWTEKFKVVFRDKEGVQVSLRRLSPLRNDDAHARPSTQTEILYLAAEAVRLLRAIGIMTH